MKDKSITDYYETTDLAITAYLISIGYNDYRVEWLERRAYFIFHYPEKKIHDEVVAYFTDKSLVNPRLYHSTYIDLKRLLYKQV